ncbi:MAG TPA: DsrE family protein [Thermoleophilia bacterium]|nr:DsrE family protein [Thermoleophilia bacterium]
MASVLFVLNDAPYGSERSYNALRHALAVAKQNDARVKVFLTADATACALAGQSPPEGYYSMERMLKGLVAKKADIGL